MAKAIELSRRPRTPNLRTDLIALGFTGRLDRLPICAEAPAPDGEPGWLGALYVTEGATMGGAQISRALAKSGFSSDQIRFFTAHGKAGAAMWRSFLARLDSVAADPRATQAAEASARAVFAAFEDWMKDWRGAASS